MDELAIQEVVAAAGATYIANDAMSSAATQKSNVESLIEQGATVLIVVAQNGTTIAPSMASARQHGVPVIPTTG